MYLLDCAFVRSLICVFIINLCVSVCIYFLASLICLVAYLLDVEGARGSAHFFNVVNFKVAKNKIGETQLIHM